MPLTHEQESSSLFHDIEAVIVAQHQLMMRLEQISKTADLPDDRNFKLVRLLSKHLAKESARLERMASKLERQFMKRLRIRAH